MHEGVTKYSYKGATVLRLHYSAIHDPATPEGLKWIEEESSHYPGGIRGTAWRREQEIDWSARGRNPVFENWHILDRHVFCDPFDVPSSWQVFMGYDYGWRSPFCATFWAYKSALEPFIVDEIYEEKLSASEQGELIKANPWFSRIEYAIGDPSIWRMDQNQMSGGSWGPRGHSAPRNPTVSIGSILRNVLGITIREGRNDPESDVAYRDLLLGTFWRNPEKPTLKIFKHCRNHRAEYRQLHFKDYVSKSVEDNKNLMEKIASKKNHAWDADKYLALSRPRPLRLADERSDWNTLDNVRRAMAERRQRLRRALY